MEITPNSGTGSGPITPDGSPVEFYKLVPVGAEPDIVAGVVPAGGSVLDLGAGSGAIALCIAWVTVGGTAVKAARRKPVLALRYE